MSNKNEYKLIEKEKAYLGKIKLKGIEREIIKETETYEIYNRYIAEVNKYYDTNGDIIAASDEINDTGEIRLVGSMVKDEKEMNDIIDKLQRLEKDLENKKEKSKENEKKLEEIEKATGLSREDLLEVTIFEKIEDKDKNKDENEKQDKELDGLASREEVNQTNDIQVIKPGQKVGDKYISEILKEKGKDFKNYVVIQTKDEPNKYKIYGLRNTTREEGEKLGQNQKDDGKEVYEEIKTIDQSTFGLDENVNTTIDGENKRDIAIKDRKQIGYGIGNEDEIVITNEGMFRKTTIYSIRENEKDDSNKVADRVGTIGNELTEKEEQGNDNLNSAIEPSELARKIMDENREFGDTNNVRDIEEKIKELMEKWDGENKIYTEEELKKATIECFKGKEKERQPGDNSHH